MEVFLILTYCLILTLAMELLIGLIWRVSNRDFILIVLVNTLTNPAVNYLVMLLGSRRNAFWIILLESAVVVTEAFCYKKRGENIRRPLLFSLSANAASYLFGVILSAVL